MPTNDIDSPTPNNLQMPNGKLIKEKENDQIYEWSSLATLQTCCHVSLSFLRSPHKFDPGDLVLNKMNVN